MSKRIINIESGPNGAPPPGPQTMEELLNAAQARWKAGDKHGAFVTALGAIAMMSKGVAQAMRCAEEALKKVEALEAKLEEQKEPGIQLPSPQQEDEDDE